MQRPTDAKRTDALLRRAGGPPEPGIPLVQTRKDVTAASPSRTGPYFKPGPGPSAGKRATGPNVNFTLDGQPRRIVDIMAMAPFTIAMNRPLAKHREDIEAFGKMSMLLCEMLVNNRATVVFADDIARTFADCDDCVEALKRSPRPMPPTRNCIVEFRNSAHKGLFGMAVTAISIDFENFGPDPKERERFYDIEEQMWHDWCVANLDLEEQPTWTDSYGLEIRRIRSTGDDGIAEYKEHRIKVIAGRLGDEARAREIMAGMDRAPNLGVSIQGAMFIQHSHGMVMGPMATYDVPLDTDRCVIMGKKSILGKVTPQSRIGGGDAAVEGKALHEMSTLGLAVMLRTFSMMACSNIVYEEHTTNNRVPPKRRDRERLAMIRYTVLKVKVGERIVSIAGESGEGGVALHMCRGHFKDFSRGAGLFGKWKKSAVWIPQHARGNPEFGTVVKDYDAAPEEAPAPVEGPACP